MAPKDKDEHGKDPARKTPMDLPGVSPESYDTGLADPSGKAPLSEGAKKLATQTGTSG